MSPSVSPARAAAFDILLRVERDGAFASELLHSSRLDDLSLADRGLATELVFGVLRWQSALDDAIAAQSSQPLRKLDSEVLLALRIGCYQLRFLTRIPANAAVNESVELVKRARKRSAVPFANAVLRKLTKTAEPATNPSFAEQYAHPEWMVERWIENYGAAAAEAICCYDQQVPETNIRLPFDPSRRQRIEEELQSAGITLAAGNLLVAARDVVSGDVRKTAASARGDLWIQDEASQLVALLAGHGSRILDCCAAPGGKTSILAERNPTSPVVALELHPRRAELLRNRVHASNVEVTNADITQYRGESIFDCVLADVPCSGTGTLARNPDIKWRLKPEDLADLHQRQVAILRSAVAQLSPGGRLVYSTCSLEPEEGEEVVETVLSAGAKLLDCASELDKISSELASSEPETLCSGPFVRTIPGVHPCDGFFAAILTTK